MPDDPSYSASSGEGLIGGGGPAAPAERRAGPERRKSAAPYSGPERRAGARRIEPAARPAPDYGHHASAGTHKLSGKVAQIDSGNVYGLASKSELNYPAAYAPVSREMWSELSAEKQAEIMRTQAIAQEKVGFEKHAPKYFIADFDPANPNAPAIAPAAGRRAPSLAGDAAAGATGAGSAAASRMLVGGVLIGAGGLGLALAAVGQLPMLPGGAAAGVALVIGAVLAAMSWR